MPEYLCKSCEVDVNRNYEKRIEFNDLERKWVEKLETQKPSHIYLQVLKVVEVRST